MILSSCLSPSRTATCAFCRAGLQTSCVHGGFFGTAERRTGHRPKRCVSLWRTEHSSVLPAGKDDALMPSLLTLSDVMGTGHHAAVIARVEPGKNWPLWAMAPSASLRDCCAATRR